MIYPQIDDVTFEETAERLKVVMPAERHRIYLIIYSILLFVWSAVTIWMIVQLLSTSLSNLSLFFIVVWAILLLIWAYVWYRLGRHVWRWWQYYMATREILFIYEEILIVRRPLSILGVDDGYDMEHVGPFYYSEKRRGVAFDYGSRGGTFGKGLSPAAAERLSRALNRRYFPQALLDEEE
ncbi:MAG: hypothetical protein R3248_04445 [Candidatus Promineifilaceae bacterium]|nr:hypothetical protein [Candidatus Promineifilaceae bacterium]